MGGRSWKRTLLTSATGGLAREALGGEGVLCWCSKAGGVIGRGLLASTAAAALPLPLKALEPTSRRARSLCTRRHVFRTMRKSNQLTPERTAALVGGGLHLLQLHSHRAQQLPALALDERGLLRVHDAPDRA